VSTAQDTSFLQGIWPALLTPLDAALDIDHAAFAAHTKALLAAGCAGATPFGTTGEGPSFSVDERRTALDALLNAGVSASQLLVSTSCAALPDVLALTRHAVNAGAAGCLLMPPFFLKGVPDAGVLEFYRRVIDGVADAKLRLVLYHIPQVSGVALSIAVVGALLEQYPGTIVGIKDSGCERAQSLRFAEALMPPLQVWVGNEPDLQVLAARGSRGAVSGVANIMPRLVQRLVMQHAGPRAAVDLQRVQALLDILPGYGLTAAFKAVMAMSTGQPGWRRVRAPLVALDDAACARLEAQVRAFAIDPLRD
jgi:4-hydroxy-tetrahydrodipicolinate synthase